MQERKQFDASHFGTGLQADNMNMKDKTSASGTKTTDYCALVLFQDATEKVTRKPDILDAEKISQRLTEALSCQIIKPRFKGKDRPSLDINMPIASVADDSEYMIQTNKQFIIETTRCALSHKIQYRIHCPKKF